MPKRILITGSRHWAEREAVESVIQRLKDTYRDIAIVHGACRTGADAIANAYCLANGITVERYPADWGKYPYAAGPIRNQKMVDSGPDFVVGFPYEGGTGTIGCLEMARDAGIQFFIVQTDGSVLSGAEAGRALQDLRMRAR